MPSHKCFPLKSTISFVLNNLISHEHLPVYFQWSHIHFKKGDLGIAGQNPKFQSSNPLVPIPGPFPLGWQHLSWGVKLNTPSPAPRGAELPANDLDASDTRRGAERKLKVPSLWVLLILIYISQFPIIPDSHSPSVSPSWLVFKLLKEKKHMLLRGGSVVSFKLKDKCLIMYFWDPPSY